MERTVLVTLKQLCSIVDTVLLGDTVVVVVQLVIIIGVQEMLVGQVLLGFIMTGSVFACGFGVVGSSAD